MVAVITVLRGGYFIQLVWAIEIYLLKQFVEWYKTFALYDIVFTFSENRSVLDRIFLGVHINLLDIFLPVLRPGSHCHS